MNITPAAERFPEGGGVALALDVDTLDTGYTFTDWFPTREWPVFTATLRFEWKSVGSGVTSYEYKVQGKGAAGPEKNLRSTLSGTTTTTTEHTIADAGAHDYVETLQTTDQAGWDFIRVGVKYTGAGPVTDDAATVQVVKGMLS